MDSPEVTGWGFVGASNIASRHMVQAVRAQSGHDVVAVMSASAQRARDFASQHEIAGAYDALDALLADPRVQVVYVSTTNELHHAQVLGAAAAGKHVLCEKPLALTTQDALEMARACQRAGVVMATNHHLRNAATHRKMRELVQGGAIGRPLFARVFHAVHLSPNLQGWRINKPEAGGGVVLDIAVHDVDTLRFVLGAEPVEAIAMTQRAGMATAQLEDGAMAVLRFDNDALVQIHVAFTTPQAWTGIEYHGDQGSVTARGAMTQRAAGEVMLADAQGERLVPVEHENLYVRGVRAFCAALRGEGEPAASGLDGVRSLHAALAILESARSGRCVPISAVSL